METVVVKRFEMGVLGLELEELGGFHEDHGGVQIAGLGPVIEQKIYF